MRHLSVFAALRVTLAVALLVATSALAGGIDLPDPVPGLGDPKQTRRAILAGMALRDWQIERETPGRILATLKVRRHVAKSWIDYHTDQITFTYGGSTNMKCKLGWPVEDPPRCLSIHQRYNTWLENLRNDVAKEVQRKREMPESASHGR